MAASCKMRNVSTTYQARFMTPDGNVRVEQFKKGLWSVMPRGQMPFMVRSKAKAFEEACAIAERRRRRR